MAKQDLVAKVRFDDGTKKGGDGKSVDYNVGEKYLGNGEEMKAAKKNGFICTPDELQASQVVLDEKDKKIRDLERQLDAAKLEVNELRKQLSDKKPVAEPQA